MSRAISAKYLNSCPICDAGPGEPCRTLRTGRVTDTHLDRIHTQHETPTDPEEGTTP